MSLPIRTLAHSLQMGPKQRQSTFRIADSVGLRFLSMSRDGTAGSLNTRALSDVCPQLRTGNEAGQGILIKDITAAANWRCVCNLPRILNSLTGARAPSFCSR